jgi:uroporphyrinogen decarboxylase
MHSRERFLAALNGDPVDRPPVWLMRQAGRYLPEYRAVRATHGFWDVCRTPALSTQVALEPLAKFKLDAAIVFSDILVIPDALGMGVSFGADKKEGPQIARPLRTRADLDAWPVAEVAQRLRFIPDALTHLREALTGRYGLIGFAGAPFTLFAYMVEGSGSDDFVHARTLLHREPELAHRALHTLADLVADLLLAEIAAGADAVQIFDTWGGLLSADEYRTFAVPAIRHIAERLGAHKLLLYVKNAHHLLPLFGETGAGGFSLDWRISLSEARALYPKHVLQGNIDPVLLFSPEAAVRERTRALIKEARALNGGARTIINLGHGILPGTPPENVAALCDEVARA